MAQTVVRGTSQEQEGPSTEVLLALYNDLRTAADLKWIDVKLALSNMVTIPDHYNFTEDVKKLIVIADEYQGWADSFGQQFFQSEPTISDDMKEDLSL